MPRTSARVPSAAALPVAKMKVNPNKKVGEEVEHTFNICLDPVTNIT
jgi:hypothetical protein